MLKTYYIGSGELTFDLIEEILESKARLELSPEAIAKIEKCRNYLDRKTETSEVPLYGITTGFVVQPQHLAQRAHHIARKPR